MRRAWLWAMLALALTAASAKADEGVLLRYKWVEGQQLAWLTSTEQSGTMTITGTEGREVKGGKTRTAKTVYVHVDRVTPEGLAYLRVSFGLVTTDQDDGKGAKSHSEMNPLDGTTVVGDGPNRTTFKRALGAGELYLKGFTAAVDDRGQVREVLDNDDLVKLLAGRPDSAELLRRVAAAALDAAPVLPEKPVKLGDEWQVDALTSTGGVIEYAPDSTPVMATFRYDGEEKVGEVACRRISLRAEGADVDVVSPAGLNNGLETEVHLARYRVSANFYLSAEDGAVWQGKTSAVMGIRAHVHGAQKTPEGEKAVDLVVTCGNRSETGEIKRL